MLCGTSGFLNCFDVQKLKKTKFLFQASKARKHGSFNRIVFLNSALGGFCTVLNAISVIACLTCDKFSKVM